MPLGRWCEMSGENIAAPLRERPRLLLVEDDAGVRRSLQLLFRAQGFDVRAYAAGAALLDDPLSGDACCFVADFRLEQSDGIEVLCRLRERGWPGPAILITAFPSAELTERALAQGFAHVLEKPLREHALTGALARLTGVGKRI
ncbi:MULTISPECIES: response regulator transcription factor [Sphingomonadaceae]|jgi:FixJ family two-component response regulator|nr:MULTISPECIES: response regulator [Sphingomonadaceae]AZI37499.1 response regulator [Caenibius tardaugens NBRC 16725]EZP66553.1 putative response regulator [Sphingomonas paucimobilis]AMK24761.1 response regulator receiver protein [Sphingobium sp. TKS]KMS63350.1 regulator [Sphingobium baderi LL03]WDA35331.1 response regulator [Sphingobium sp. YC-XJ3]